MLPPPPPPPHLKAQLPLNKKIHRVISPPLVKRSLESFAFPLRKIYIYYCIGTYVPLIMRVAFTDFFSSAPFFATFLVYIGCAPPSNQFVFLRLLCNDLVLFTPFISSAPFLKQKVFGMISIQTKVIWICLDASMLIKKLNRKLN